MKRYEIKIDPVLKALEKLVVDSGGEISPDEAVELLRTFGLVAQAATEDPEAPMEFYRVLGAHTMLCMVRRAASEKIASRLLARIRPE